MSKKDDRLIIYEKIVKLIFYSRNLLIKFPKSERFDLCESIKSSELYCLRQIIYAWKEKDNLKRYEYLENADIEIFVLKTYTRISYMSKYITDKNFNFWNEQLTEIGKMIGGWKKTCQKN